MNYTENLNLPQWEGSDRIDHEDFNEAMEKIDEAVAGKAAASAVTALQSAVNAAGNCRIVTGSYVGTGEYGESHPNTLTFDFEPKLVVVMKDGANFVLSATSAHWAMFVRGVTSYQARYSSSNQNGTTYDVQWGDRSVSWFGAGRDVAWAGGQLNLSDTTYHYIAIG